MTQGITSLEDTKVKEIKYMKKKLDLKLANMKRYSGLISMKSPIKNPIEKISRIDQMKLKRNKN